MTSKAFANLSPSTPYTSAASRSGGQVQVMTFCKSYTSEPLHMPFHLECSPVPLPHLVNFKSFLKPQLRGHLLQEAFAVPEASQTFPPRPPPHTPTRLAPIMVPGFCLPQWTLSSMRLRQHEDVWILKEKKKNRNKNLLIPSPHLGRGGGA